MASACLIESWGIRQDGRARVLRAVPEIARRECVSQIAFAHAKKGDGMKTGEEKRRWNEDGEIWGIMSYKEKKR